MIIDFSDRFRYLPSALKFYDKQIMKKIPLSITSLLAFISLCNSLSAANLVVNGSLEDVLLLNPSTSIPAYDSIIAPTGAELSPSLIAGWTRVAVKYDSGVGLGATVRHSLAGMELKRNDDPATTDTLFGDQFGFFADVYQTISGLVPGDFYVVSGYAIVDASGSPLSTASFSMSVFDSTLFNGTLDQTSAGVIPTTLAVGLINSTINGNDANWRKLDVTFTAPASGSIALYVAKTSVGAAVCNWDNMFLDSQAIPEPSSLLLVGMVAPFALIRRRKSL